MSKKLYMLFGLALLAILAYGLIGTGAWFTDTEEIANNSVTTGELDLTVWGGPFTIENLEPGAPSNFVGYFCTRNDGDYDIKWRGWMTETVDDANLRSKLLVSVVMNPPARQGNYGPANYALITDAPFSQLTSPNNYFVITDAADPLFVNYWACYDIYVRLDGSAPNTMQNASLTTKFYVEATQRLNPGWSQ